MKGNTFRECDSYVNKTLQKNQTPKEIGTPIILVYHASPITSSPARAEIL